MLKTEDGGRVVHFPENPGKFQFDAEVARVFADMALRAIPNFYAAHSLHASMVKPWLKNEACSILDIGSSRGAFLSSLEEDEPGVLDRLSVRAVDASEAMCDYLREDFPMIDVECIDITEPEFISRGDQYDIVCCNYTLQFVSVQKQLTVLDRIVNTVKPGGVLIFGHKASHEGRLGDIAHKEYIRFRTDRGYTKEEIEAKTLALKGSMFPMSHEFLMAYLKRTFTEVQETTRFMMFSTLMARK